MKVSRHIKIHPALFLFAVVFFLLGRGEVFLLTVLFVTLHELSHMAAAFILGAKLSEIWITPIGERAVIKNLDSYPTGAQSLILLLGPLSNIMVFLVCRCLLPVNIWTVWIADINFCIGIFNLVPVFPLDGGRLALLWGGSLFGTLRCAAFLAKASRYFGIFLCSLGIVQLALFPWNASLLLLGIYIWRLNREEYGKISIQFFRSMVGRVQKGMKKVRVLYAAPDTRLLELVTRFDQTHYHTVLYHDKQELRYMTEEGVFRMMLEQGPLCCLNEYRAGE